MDLETIYYLSQIVAVVLILASLLFLAFQIADSNRQLRSQGYYNFMDLSHRPLEMLAQSSGLAEIIDRAEEDPHALSSSEWLRCQNYIFMLLNSWEYCFYQHKDRTLPKALWVGSDRYFGDIAMRQLSFQRFWSEYGDTFAEPFRSHVNLVMDGLGSEKS